METLRKRIRREYAPLSVSIAVACDSAFSPLTQVYDSASAEYEPDRYVSPTVIRPIITANATDGSWPDPHANHALANMKWYANGVDISTISSWEGKYEIDQVGATRGSLIIYRNVAPSERISLHFEAVLADDRLGVNLPIVTDEIILSTIDKSVDSWSADLSADKSILYNPFLDKLHLYDYKVSHGLISASSGAEAAARDGNEYERTIPFQVYKGGVRQTSGFTVQLYRVVSTSSLTELTADDDEVVSISTSAVVLDLRMIEKDNYMLIFKVSGSEIARVQFSVSRVYQSFTCEPSNDAPIVYGQTERYDEAIVNSEGKIVDCPASIIEIVWKTDSAYATGVTHNEGGTTEYQLSKTGVGQLATDDWLDIYTTATQKPCYSVAIDEDANILTDENGNDLIFN